MSAFPLANDISNAADQGVAKAKFEAFLAATKELLGAAAETELTLATGSVVPTAGIHSIDTEVDAATDDLTNITQTNHPDGRLLLIHAVNDARTVVVKHAAGGTGQVFLADDADFSLDQSDKWLLLKRTGTTWEEIFRSYGSDLAASRMSLGLPGTGSNVSKKIVNATRDMTAASGTQTIPGAGGTPVGVRVIYGKIGTTIGGTGHSDGTTDRTISTNASNQWNSDALLIKAEQSGGISQTAVLTSLDSDGITLTWTKGGSPSAGNLEMSFEFTY
jgi:hypothetical protein